MDKASMNRPHGSEHHNAVARMDAFIVLNGFTPESFWRTYNVHWQLAYAPRTPEHKEEA